MGRASATERARKKNTENLKSKNNVVLEHLHINDTQVASNFLII